MVAEPQQLCQHRTGPHLGQAIRRWPRTPPIRPMQNAVAWVWHVCLPPDSREKLFRKHPLRPQLQRIAGLAVASMRCRTLLLGAVVGRPLLAPAVLPERLCDPHGDALALSHRVCWKLASEHPERHRRVQRTLLRSLEYAPPGAARDRGVALLAALLSAPHYAHDHDPWFEDLPVPAIAGKHWPDRAQRLAQLAGPRIRWSGPMSC
ncbi:hypothetical protein ACFQGW_17210 [Xanthomonas theicola]